jgi:DNA ligase 1
MIKPMLAYKVDKKPVNWSEKVFMQPKLDGVRCVISKAGAFSRTGKPWLNIDHILSSLVPVFREYPDLILDGELYNHELKNDFEKIISLVRKTKPTASDRVESCDLVQFHCYDYITPDNSDVFEKRMKFLSTAALYSYCVKYVPTHYVATRDLANAIHEDWLDAGYEGSILRLNGVYECKRSYNLQKFKDFHDTEATIVGYVPGQGKFTGLIGKFLMRDDYGVEFGCPIGKGYNFQDRRDILTNVQNYVGKRATFTYFERTKANSYRHPLYKTLRNYE